jgi:hypothetical protein
VPTRLAVQAEVVDTRAFAEHPLAMRAVHDRSPIFGQRHDLGHGANIAVHANTPSV